MVQQAAGTRDFLVGKERSPHMGWESISSEAPGGKQLGLGWDWLFKAVIFPKFIQQNSPSITGAGILSRCIFCYG